MKQPKLSTLIRKIDLAVERSDYADMPGFKEDLALVNLISENWPQIERALLASVAAGIDR